MPAEQPAWVLTRRELIGARIRDARVKVNLSQAELGRRVGVDHKTIHRIEYGTSDPGLGLLIQLAHAVNVPLSELVK